MKMKFGAAANCYESRDTARKKIGVVPHLLAGMKDRGRKRGVLAFLWCSLLLLVFSAYSVHIFRFLFTEIRFHPRLVSKRNSPAAMEAISTAAGSGVSSVTRALSIRETVIFPDQVVVFLRYLPSAALFTEDSLCCTYFTPNSSQQLQVSPVSIYYDDENHHQIVRCPLQQRGTLLSLGVKPNGNLVPGSTYRWDSLAYEAMIDTDNSTLVFVKGLNLRPGRVANASNFRCLYGWVFRKSRFVLWADAVSVAQEIVRCRTPLSVLNNPQRFTNSNDPVKVTVRVVGRRTVNSISRLKHRSSTKQFTTHPKQHEMCVCTMLRNQAQFLREWIMYHSVAGVQRWFIYDNNSDDDIADVLELLVAANYNVTRHVWPWIKTQEAGFAHCALRAKDSCEWVGFIDVDEFLHFPSGLSLHDIVANRSMPSDVAEIRVSCHSFGPSGLKQAPKKGVMAGYTCRVAAPERHKSIVKPWVLNSSLINMVHHFHLKSGFRYVNMNASMLVINHYKYQVWQVFKEKFYRRVATYVSDWQQDRNVGSKDRAPGLGTKAIEPLDWSTRFCEVQDSALRDRVLETFADRETGYMPWEDKLLSV